MRIIHFSALPTAFIDRFVGQSWSLATRTRHVFSS